MGGWRTCQSIIEGDMIEPEAFLVMKFRVLLGRVFEVFSARQQVSSTYAADCQTANMDEAAADRNE